MPISFNAIPIDIRTPGQFIEIDNSRAVGGLPAQLHKILVIGQRLPTGTVPANTLVQVLTAADAETMFGRGSMLASMFAELKHANPHTSTWAVALDDAAAGVQATGSVTFGGTVTATGKLNLYIAGKPVRVDVAAAETNSATAAKVSAAINAQTDLPVTAAVDGVDNTKVNLTARHKGATGNDIDIRLNYFQGESLPTGMTATIVAMANGANNPDIADAIAAIADEQFHTWIIPYTDSSNLDAVEAELEARWSPMSQKEGHAYTAARGSHANLITLGDSRNSPHVSIIGANQALNPPWEWAAVFGAVCAFHGAIDPARPFQTLRLGRLLPPAELYRFTRAERDLLLRDGISTFIVDSGGNVLIERAITTYQETAGGVPDVSYLDVNTVLTVAYLRFTVRARIAQKFPRHKLADDGTVFGAGQPIVTPSIIRAELIALAREWEASGLVENIDQFKEDLLVERDGTDLSRVNALIPPDIINQLRVFAGQVQFRL